MKFAKCLFSILCLLIVSNSFSLTIFNGTRTKFSYKLSFDKNFKTSFSFYVPACLSNNMEHACDRQNHTFKRSNQNFLYLKSDQLNQVFTLDIGSSYIYGTNGDGITSLYSY